jgi:hypothetical protein
LFSNKGTWAGHAAKGNKVNCIVMTNALYFKTNEKKIALSLIGWDDYSQWDNPSD